MDFGVFDHLDRNDLSLPEFYEARLAIIEAYDQAGFHAYHIAEHHSTPLGMAASPSVFLAAVAQRTQRLRFGPLVYALPLYHPLRVIEEICMLDSLSNGRLEIGFGRGSSPIEVGYFGQSYDIAQRVYAESLEIIIKGLTSKTLDFKGEFFRLEDVPMTFESLQKPYPPIWYGVHSVESAQRAARRALNIVSLSSPAATRAYADGYRAVWKELQGAEAPTPKIGMSNFVVVAESDDAAMNTARRAYDRWYRNFTFTSSRVGKTPINPRPASFEEVLRAGQGVAGTPEKVATYLKASIATAGINYFVGQFAFGDLSQAETTTSINLFVRDVMPALMS